MIMIYACMVVITRIYLLDDRVPMWSFADTWGPLVISLVMVAAYILSAYFASMSSSLYYIDGFAYPLVTQSCVQPQCFTGILAPPEFSTRGMTVNPKSGVVYAVSDSSVFATTGEIINSKVAPSRVA